MTTKTKPNLMAQFADEPLEAEGFKWRNVYLHHNNPAYYGPTIGDKAERKFHANDILSELKKYGGEYDVITVNHVDVIHNDVYLVIQIPVKER